MGVGSAHSHLASVQQRKRYKFNMKHTQREKQRAKKTLHHQLQMSQVRRIDQIRYPMTEVASLSAVPQSCRTPLRFQPELKGGDRVFCHSAHTRPSKRGVHYLLYPEDQICSVLESTKCPPRRGEREFARSLRCRSEGGDAGSPS